MASVANDAGEAPKEMSQAEIIQKLQESFDAAQDAQRNGDWASYGEHLKEVQRYIDMLN